MNEDKLQELEFYLNKKYRFLTDVDYNVIKDKRYNLIQANKISLIILNVLHRDDDESMKFRVKIRIIDNNIEDRDKRDLFIKSFIFEDYTKAVRFYKYCIYIHNYKFGKWAKIDKR